jgi:hypothetical protein
MIVFSLLSLLIKLFTRGVGVHDERSAAQNIHSLQKGMYSGAHEYRHADDSELRGLNVDFYDRSTAAFESIGFRRMGQIINVTAQRVTPWAYAVLRCFVDPSRTVMGAVYDVRFRSWYRGLQLIGVLARNMRTIDLETELSDGQFVCTSNASQAALASDFTGVHRRFFSKDVPIPELVERHREHIAQVLAGCEPNVRPIAHSSFEEYRASQDRLQLLKSAHRASQNFDPAAELARIQGRPLTKREQQVARQIEELRENERNEA